MRFFDTAGVAVKFTWRGLTIGDWQEGDCRRRTDPYCRP